MQPLPPEATEAIIALQKTLDEVKITPAVEEVYTFPPAMQTSFKDFIEA